MILPDFFEAPPSVYAVENEYQIIVPVNHECLMWVRVGSEEYYDDSEGDEDYGLDFSDGDDNE